MNRTNNNNGTNGADASRPKNMKARVDMLQSRRWKIVLEELLEALTNSKAAEVTVDLVDLILIFGTDFRRSPDKWGSTKRGLFWPWLDHCKVKGYPADRKTNRRVHQFGYAYNREITEQVAEKDRNEALWDALKPVIADQLRGFYKVSDIVANDVVTDIRRVAALIGFPVEARKATADFTLRVPRAWGKGIDPHTLAPIAGSPGRPLKLAA